MKIVKYTFILMFITSSAKIVSMHCDEIKEIGRTANISRVQELLDNGISINAKSSLDYTMLFYACSYTHEMENSQIPAKKRLEFIEFLLQNGSELSPMLRLGSSDISSNIIALFIKYGADVNMSHPFNNMTLLNSAALNGKLDIVQCLLDQKNIQINDSDKSGQTPLMSAAFFCHAKVVKLLLEHGADVTRKDNSEKTALDHARSYCYREHKKSQTIKYLILKLLAARGKTLDANVDVLYKSFLT